MQNTVLSSGLALALALPAVAQASEWSIDADHSRASFSVRHMMVSDVRGDLGAIDGKIAFDEKNPTKSAIDVTIDLTGIDTRNKKRDDHLRSPDFFGVEKHPKLRFVSNKIMKNGKGYKVKGDLTIRGVTKPVTLDATVSKPIKSPWGTTVVGLQGKTKIDRRDFGLKWNAPIEAGGVVVGHDVDVFVEVELTKK